MITNTNERFNGAPCPPMVRDQTISDAMESLVIYELGYGGQICEITPTKIVLFTRCLAAQDTVTLEGPADEMRPLIEFCGIYAQICGIEEINQAVTDHALNRTMEMSGGRPLIVTTLGPMLMGQSRVKLTCLAWINIEDETLIKRAAKMELKQLLEICLFMEQFPDMGLLEVAEALNLEVPALVT